MNISDTLYFQVNLQYGQELTNHDIYEQLQSCAENVAYDGFAKYFKDAAKEELEHADAFRSFMIDRNRLPKIPRRPEQVCEFTQAKQMFQFALESEEQNTAKLLSLYESFHKENDKEAKVFLQFYLTEQRKAERELKDFVMRLERCGSEAAVSLIDIELKK